MLCMVSNLYFFANAFFDIPSEDEGEYHRIEDHIERPRDGEAGHQQIKGGILRIDKSHPDNTENKREGDI